MSDSIDEAQTREERFRAESLARAGIMPRAITIPPPHYVGQEPEPAFCRACGGKPEIGSLCGPCGRQLDKGER